MVPGEEPKGIQAGTGGHGGSAEPNAMKAATH